MEICIGSALYSESLKRGEEYTTPHKVVIVWLMGYNQFEDGSYHEESEIVKKSNKEILTEDIKYHYIQMPKFIEEVEEIKTREEQWLGYLSCQLNKEELEELFKMNKNIKEVNEIVERVLADKEIQEEILNRKLIGYTNYLKEKKIYEDGVAETTKKMNKTMNKKLKEQEIESSKKLKEQKIDIAKKMKEQKIDIEIIMKITGLNKEEIEKI